MHTATLSNGQTATIVGRIDAYPGHPATGTTVELFPDTPANIAQPYALISVTWATEVTTINANTGHSVTEHIPGYLGMPSGTTWYLTPVTAAADGYATTSGYAAGHLTAALPNIPYIDHPSAVKVHDFPNN